MEACSRPCHRCRWKALALYEPARNDLLVFGGDPVGARDTGNKYLDDLWRLDGSDLHAPVWQKANGSALQGTGTECATSALD